MNKGSAYNKLHIFQTIVRSGSIRGAARQLEMAAPSVSLALKQLETHLGLPLFSRTTRRIELTEAGQQLYETTCNTMQDLDYALESVQELRQKPSGKVSITLPHFMYQSYFRQIYPEFCHRYPDIQLEISVSDESINILNSGHDLGIRFGNLVEPGMVAHQLIPPDKEALFVSPDYLQRFGKPLKPEDLQQHKLVQYRFIASNQLAPLELTHNGQSIAVNMPCGLIVNDTNALIDGALNGLGVGRMLVPLVQEYLDDGRLIPVLQDYWPTYPGMYLYFLQNSQKARRVRVLIDFLLEKSRSG